MLNGFLVIDKPSGITSHDVVSRVRRILGTRRVGHTGTLDPFATGVLPIAINDGTKAIPFLDEGVKQYDAVMRLGIATDTLDSTGRVIAEGDWTTVGHGLLEGVLTRFVGVIEQIPPMFSAIKRDGQPLYKLARQGIEIERPPRQVEIQQLELLDVAPPLVSLRVTCSRGTYIRSLADDIGRALGCGATLETLRRTVSGPFRLESACTLETLQWSVEQAAPEQLCVTPMEALAHLPLIPISAAGLAKVRHGRSPEWPETLLDAPQACVRPELARLGFEGNLVAVAQMLPSPEGVARIVLKRVFV